MELFTGKALMPDFLSRAEIQARFPDEWVLIGDPQVDKTLTVQAGKVLAHDKDRAELHRQLIALRPGRFAVLYMATKPDDTVYILRLLLYWAQHG